MHRATAILEAGMTSEVRLEQPSRSSSTVTVQASGQENGTQHRATALLEAGMTLRSSARTAGEDQADNHRGKHQDRTTAHSTGQRPYSKQA